VTQTRTLRLRDDAAEEVASVAEAEGLSVSGLIAEALEDAVENGLDDIAEPFPAGSRTVGAALDERLIRRVARAAEAENLTFSDFARAALAGYLVEGEDDRWPAVFDHERRREAVADAAAAGLRRLAAARSATPEPLSSLPPPAQARREGTFVVVRDCLHVTRERPDAAGYVLCSECGRWAPIAPPGSIEYQHVVMREQLRRERARA
jgi:hypothetical protein